MIYEQYGVIVYERDGRLMLIAVYDPDKARAWAEDVSKRKGLARLYTREACRIARRVLEIC